MILNAPFPSTFLDFLALFVAVFPALLILALAGLRTIDNRCRRSRSRDRRPGREVVRRRGGWLWRQAL